MRAAGATAVLVLVCHIFLVQVIKSLILTSKQKMSHIVYTELCYMPKYFSSTGRNVV